MLAEDLDAAGPLRVPDGAENVDRLGERIDGVARRAARTADGLDGVPEGSGTEAELEAPAGEDVEA
jgi:hypothetical protein